LIPIPQKNYNITQTAEFLRKIQVQMAAEFHLLVFASAAQHQNKRENFFTYTGCSKLSRLLHRPWNLKIVGQTKGYKAGQC
jgi:hypothetical protein